MLDPQLVVHCVQRRPGQGFEVNDESIDGRNIGNGSQVVGGERRLFITGAYCCTAGGKP
jgi:hypothetical protein